MPHTAAHRDRSITIRSFAGGKLLLLCLALACVVSVASTSSALAATPGQSYGYTSDIGTPDAGALTQSFANAVAVSNDDGNVFIARQGDAALGQDPAVDVLDPATGASLSRPVITSIFPRGVAVSADGSAFFVTDAIFLGVPQKWIRSSTSPLTYTQDPSWNPTALVGTTGMAVDPTTGELVVADGGRIVRLDPASGAVLSSFDGSSSGAGTFQGLQSIAVAPNSDVYAVDFPGRVAHFGADGSWKGSLSLPTTQTMASGIAVNPQNGDVGVELPSGFGLGPDATIRVYTATNTPKDVIRVMPAQANDSSGQFNNVGLAFAPDGSKLYVALKNGRAHVYSRDTQPGVDAPVLSDITATGAHVSANVATGGESTLARIEYCLASDPCDINLTSGGPSPWHALPDHAGLTGGSDPANPVQDPIADELTGLAPNERYLLRTYAINDTNQIENRSAMTSLTTAVPAPLVRTGTVDGVTDTVAELSGSVDNTFGGQTTYHFEYGLTTNYEHRLPAGTEGVAGSLRTPRTFTQAAKGLQPGTVYHYRLVATNSGGTTAGADRTFTTLGVDQVAPDRGYEQVTAANKKGLSLLANWGFQASSDGSAFEYAATSPSTDAVSHVVVSRYAARRTTSDWVDQQPLDPPFISARTIINSLTLGVSDDFKHALVVSQYALTPDATEGGANLYVRDLDSGAYDLLGTATQNGAFNGFTGISQLNTFTAAARDFSWVVLISRFPLLPGAPQVAMYKWTRTSGLSLLSRLPDNSVPTGTSKVNTTGFVSDDGDTVAFTLLDGNDGAYRREAGQTEAVSVSEATGGPTDVQPAAATGISADGRFVVLTSASQLTDDDQDGGTSEYRYDAEAPAGQRLEYLGPQDGNGQGDTLGVGDDAKTIYFNSNHQVVAWREGRPGVDMVSPTAARANSFGYASPNGRYFVFVDGAGAVRLYDAVTGEKNCLSCTPDGTATAAHLPFPDTNISNRLPQSITDDGQAYFDTTTALLSADRNGTSDVYEYYKGRLTLISPGDRDFNAMLADISSDGSNVFFATAEGLVSQDTDQAYDIYSARVGGGLPGQNPAPPDVPCAKTECAEPGPGPVASPPVGSLPQPQGKSSKRTNQEKVKLSVTRVAIGAKSMKITFHASQRGRVKVSGARVVTAYKNVAKEGTYSVSVALSKKARSLRHAKKKVKLAVKVSLAGDWGTASAKYTRTLR
jgi:hypothetical protein